MNPGGYHFELVTVTEADVLLTGQRVSSDTFFLGFDWTIAVCPKCKNHIGWGFTPTNAPVGTEPTFYALIHEKLFYEMDGLAIKIKIEIKSFNFMLQNTRKA